MRDLGEWYQKFEVNGQHTVNPGFMNDKFWNNIRMLLPLQMENKKVLDLCCNAGFVSFKLKQLGAKVWAFEQNEMYIDQANYIMRNTDMPRIRIILGDVEDVELRQYEPDIIVALSCLYHLEYPDDMVIKMAATGAEVLASFRKSNYQLYMEKFKDAGMKVVAETTYGRKRAVYFR